MAERKAAKKTTKGSAPRNSSTGLTEDERAAMKERARELREEARRGADRAAGEKALLEQIGKMQGSDRAMAKRIHEIITATAPDLMPKTWYGMPAYAKDGKVLCFYQSAGKFKSRYASFGFTDEAKLDQGTMWPTYFALKELTPGDEAKIGALVKKAVR